MVGRVGQCVCVIARQIYLISKYFDNNILITDLVSLLDSVRTLHSLSDHAPNTFYTLKNRIVKIMFAAMETEKDPGNMQMLLHGKK